MNEASREVMMPAIQRIPRRVLLVGAMLALVSPCCARPNIVFILADDMGWSDTSNPLTNRGNPSDFFETPAIAELAREGMAFTCAYTNGQNCAPTRSALLTGQYGPRPTNNIFNVRSLNRSKRPMLLRGCPQGLPTGTDAIPDRAYTYAEMLQDAGYRTAHFGKFHVTEKGDEGAEAICRRHGFHENFGGSSIGHASNYFAKRGAFNDSVGPQLDAFAGEYTQPYVDQNIKPFDRGAGADAIDALVGSEKHVSDALTDATIDFMERSKQAPFLVQLHSYAVHGPIGREQARADLLGKYDHKEPGPRGERPSFAALLEGLDQNVARVIDYLKATPDPSRPGQVLAENTIVFFFSDNGGVAGVSNNGPLKGAKGQLVEGGIRVPLIAWSGNSALVEAGSINATPVIGVDFYRTFAALAKTAPPKNLTLDGVDLTGILADSTASLDRGDSLYWHFPGYLVDGRRDEHPRSVVRESEGPFKLTYHYEDQRYELYNLDDDIGEKTNLALSLPEKTAELAASLMHWLDKVDAPLATLRTGTVTLDVSGPIYANGEVRDHHGELAVHAGDEMPFVLPRLVQPR